MSRTLEPNAFAEQSPGPNWRARSDLQAAGVVLVLFIAMASATWQRWANPFIDHGREMNLPSRILAGEQLYVDVVYQYGPFAPYANALLYAIFGTRLVTLQISGLICATVILLLCYRVTRRLLGPWESAIPAALVVVLCAMAGPSGNYAQPYAFSALYGYMFSWCALLCAIRFTEVGRTTSLLWAGGWIGATVASKPELGLQAAVPALLAWGVAWQNDRRWRWRDAAAIGVSAVVVIAIACAPILLTVPWKLLVTDIYVRFTEPQLLYFTRVLSGTLGWPRTGWAVVAAIGDLMLVCGATALFGILFAPKRASAERGGTLASCALLGVGWWLATFRTLAPGLDHNVLRSAPVVLALLIGVLVLDIFQSLRRRERIATPRQALLLTAAFGLLAIIRVPLNISFVWAYAPFTLPALLVIYPYLVLRASPALLLSSSGSRHYARACAVGLMVLTVVAFGTLQVVAARQRNIVEIEVPRGRFFTTEGLGPPLRDALLFVTARTSPGDFVASLPQGTVINFLTDRPNPLREENIVPGFLTDVWETDAIARIVSKNVRVILVANVLTPEYRDHAFGVDYNQRFLRWIQENYREVATFGPADGTPLKFGDSVFFIRAFERTW